ncbi:MAG: endonuclease [Schlesneria sp.]|nr:endonuclease [Schlesneria sp.]
MRKIFLSGPYASNEVWVLADFLESEGNQVWQPDRISSGTGSMYTEEILTAIKRCDVFIAWIGKPHPNVMFELGYALGAGKTVLLIRAGDGKIPFELASFPVLAIEELSPRSLAEVAERINQATIKLPAERPDFRTARDKLRHMCDDESYLDAVAPREFEDSIAAFLKEMDLQTELLPVRNDKGFDITIEYENCLYVVDAKKLNRNSRLSVVEIQRLLGAATFAEARGAILVTSGGFTATAKYFAHDAPITIVLLTIDELVGMNRNRFVETMQS